MIKGIRKDLVKKKTTTTATTKTNNELVFRLFSYEKEQEYLRYIIRIPISGLVKTNI